MKEGRQNKVRSSEDCKGLDKDCHWWFLYGYLQDGNTFSWHSSLI